jgi:hypothetical protein
LPVLQRFGELLVHQPINRTPLEQVLFHDKTGIVGGDIDIIDTIRINHQLGP